MFSRAALKVFVAILVLGLVHGVTAFASEPKKEGKNEEVGSAEAGPESDVSESQKKQMSEAMELQGKVQALLARVKSKEEAINKLIELKNQTNDAAKVKEIIAEMVAEHKEMSKMIEEYEQNRSLLRYRYPEKGYSGTRNYERMDVKPLDQMENRMSVEVKLKRNLKTLRSQYGESAEAKASKKKKALKKETDAPSLTEPIVLQK